MNKITFYLILSFLSFSVFSANAVLAHSKEATQASSSPGLASPDFSIDEVKNYVNTVVRDGSSVLNDNKLSQAEKINRTRVLISNNLDLDWMARYTLGGYRKTLTPEQINKFIDVYSKYVIKVYANLVKDYRGEDAKVGRVYATGKTMFKVEMTIINNKENQGISVSYSVHPVKDSRDKLSLKVTDIITEGVSFLQSQQQEFTSTIANQGIDALISELVSKS